MNYIIFDLEFTVLRNQRYLSEIIEMGAIKVQEHDGQLMMLDLFHTHVRPYSNPWLSPLTIEFTGIQQEQIDAAPSFKDAVVKFQEWLGDTPYYLCSWGPDDKYQLLRHCNVHKINVDWICNFNDIQLMFTRLQGHDYGQRLSLKRSLDALSIQFIGNQHNALDDAFNTTKIFKKIFPQLTLEENNAAEE